MKICKRMILLIAMSSLLFLPLKKFSVNASDKVDKVLYGNSKSVYLMDTNSNEVLFAYNEFERMPIASVCKVATLCLCFEEIEKGLITLDEKILVSERASGMGGSQVFLQQNELYSVTDLIKSIIICSANDSCVALAERIAGSEDAFVAKMNDYVKILGCSNTIFANCTGLPKPTQYSCAHDVAIMFDRLITFPLYFEYSNIWMDDFKHPDKSITSMTNTNKLLKNYKNCRSGKTGFTNEAGFCFVANAEKNNLNLICSVLGNSSSGDRFITSINLFEYGFNNFKNEVILDKNYYLNDYFVCINGKKEKYRVMPSENCYLLSNKIDNKKELSFILIDNKLKAPIEKGQIVGKIEVYKDYILYNTIEVVAGEDVDKANYKDNFDRVVKNWSM